MLTETLGPRAFFPSFCPWSLPKRWYQEHFHSLSALGPRQSDATASTFPAFLPAVSAKTLRPRALFSSLCPRSSPKRWYREHFSSISALGPRQIDATRSTFAVFLSAVPTRMMRPRALFQPFRPRSPPKRWDQERFPSNSACGPHQIDATKSVFTALLPAVRTKTLGPRALFPCFRPRSPPLCSHIKPKLKRCAQGCQDRQCQAHSILCILLIINFLHIMHRAQCCSTWQQ